MDEVADFGLAAMLEVLGTAESLREQIDHPPEPFVVTTLGVTAQVRTGAGHTVPTVPISSLRRLPDLLIVPAVNVKVEAGLIDLVTSPGVRPVLDLMVRARAQRVELAAACTGTFVLAEAGVLDGSSATTSWWLAPVFRHRYPHVDLQVGLHLSHATGITTAGAAFSHIDLAISLVRSQSPALAALVDRYLLIGNRLSQAAFAIPSVMASFDPLAASFEEWVRRNIGQPIQISDAARALNVSERTLQRTMAATLGMSPHELINEIRVDHAAHLLRTTTLSVEVIANQVGFANVGTLRALVQRQRGMTIRELRRGFGAASAPPGQG